MESVYHRYIKRIFDLLLSVILIVLIWPLLLVVYLLVRIKIGSPAMLNQKRPGFKGRPFAISKFRTMTNERDANGDLLPDYQRITPFGRILRSYSLDELPEIFNILRGEMSFVGPRPLMMQYLDRYTKEQARRHDVMPGITGWVQVNGRNSLTWEEKFALDVWYVDHQSFWLDVRILFMTFMKVVRREGISQEGFVAAEEFMGSKDRDKSAKSAIGTVNVASPTGSMHESSGQMIGPRWENGSEFHLNETIYNDVPLKSPWDDKGLLYGTCRDALKALLLLGMASNGWKRLWVPAYFCQEVLSDIAQTGIAMECYQSWYPGNSGKKRVPIFTDGDVVLVVNFFGMYSAADMELDIGNASAFIEDHSHDPWSAWAFESKADYCVASLRKTLPIPDGGVIWSPKHRQLPALPELTAEHRLAAEQKLEGMSMKTSYLNGQASDKDGYRKLLMIGERDLCGKEISAILDWTKQHLAKFPVQKWREDRKRNHRIVREAVAPLKWVRAINPPEVPGIVPFSCVLIFDSSERRKFVREKLIQAGIYPAILWPLDKPAVQGIPAEYTEISKRMLSVHCDMRYSTEDMQHVADCIKKFGSEFKG
jgi:sugar transferase EpsL